MSAKPKLTKLEYAKMMREKPLIAKRKVIEKLIPHVMSQHMPTRKQLEAMGIILQEDNTSSNS